MPKSEPSKLVCPACNHANEAERVYCHNCGEKLDRSLLPKVSDIAATGDQAKVKRKVKQMMNPNRGAFLGNVKTFIQIIALAAVVAAVFLACLPPDAVPPAKGGMPDRRPGDLWEAMMASKPAVSLTFNEAEINYHLSRSLKHEESAIGLNFERAFVKFTPGRFSLTAQRDAYGLTIYSGATFMPVLKDGRWDAEVTALRIGRLGFPPELGKFASITLGGVGKAFANQAKQLDRLEKVDIGEGTISLATKPAR